MLLLLLGFFFYPDSCSSPVKVILVVLLPVPLVPSVEEPHSRGLVLHSDSSVG